MAKNTVKYWRTKADSLLTPIIKMLYPKCLLCPFTGKDGIPLRDNPTQVAHHHVHKSKSTVLRYFIPNLINLCRDCHMMLHNNESYWASKIVELRGLDWFQDIEKRKNKIIKADWYYFKENYDYLVEVLNK